MKPPVVEPALPYPPIPEEARDMGAPSRDEGFNTPGRYILKTDSAEWGTQSAAGARAEIQTEVTAENEQLLRTHHRSLKHIKSVCAYKDGDRPEIWWLTLGKGKSEKIVDTHAGGREIHILPSHEEPPCMAPWMEDPIDRRINSRRMLTAEDLDIIRKTCPKSVGVRILICGWAIVLFDNRKVMRASFYEQGSPLSLGQLRVGFDTISYQIAEPILWGSGVASVPGADRDLGSLGLRLQLQDGQDVITTTTHAFVDVRRSNLGLALWICSLLLYLRPTSILSRLSAVVGLRRPAANTPVGKDVWLAGTKRKVGTITKTYDPNISRHAPFPLGFVHDLSLITGENLPAIISPPGTARIIGWGDYSAVLDGAPIFVCRMKASNVVREAAGQGMSETAQDAVIVGSEYTWNRKTFSQTASLLWRKANDSNSASNLSGSVLCLGRRTDKTAKAVVFQNFEGVLKAWRAEEDHKRKVSHPELARFRGGFLLPENVRQSTIRMDSEDQKQVSKQFVTEKESRGQ